MVLNFIGDIIYFEVHVFIFKTKFKTQCQNYFDNRTKNYTFTSKHIHVPGGEEKMLFELKTLVFKFQNKLSK